MEISDLKNNASNLRKSEKYSEALELYKRLWDEHSDQCNKWDVWGYAFCLKKLKKYSECLDLCRLIYPKFKDFENIIELYAWSIYYTEIALEKIHNETNFFKAGEGILKLTKQQDKSIKKEKDFPCIYTITVFKILDYLSDKAIFNPDKIIYWTGKLNPDFLEATPFTIKDSEGKERELAPQKELYFALRSKALLKKGLFQECIDLSNIALNVLQKFHYDNDIWFKAKIANAIFHLGNSEEALNLFNEILKTKNEWFLQKEVAEIYLKNNQIDEALKISVNAALNFGEPDKKMNLYKLIADILKSQNKLIEAKKHIEFIISIRKLNNWHFDNELQQIANEYKIDPNSLPELSKQHLELKKIWENLKFGNQTLLKGAIKSILPNGKSGFIETDNKKSYYFQFKSFFGRKELIKQDLKVSFYLEEGFDKSKNKKTMNAINIKRIN